MKNRLKFEDCIEKINTEINKRRSKWNLTALAWMDFEDVGQILRIHIYKKWNLYNPAKPLSPWINRIISNQIKNLIRNNYGSFSRPCLKCAAAEGGDFCSIYTKQCSSCPLYAHWEKTKKKAFNTKLPLALENHTQEVFNLVTDSSDVEGAVERFHEKIKKFLKPNEWKVYEASYIQNKTLEEIAGIMGYKTTEKNRMPGYKQIKNIQKAILIKAKRIMEKGEIDIF
jgi:RNA polymerase sigma factor (sigma-70 family)